MDRVTAGSGIRHDGRRLVAVALGACVGISGIDHGVFEVLQGNTQPSGLVFPAIGPAHQMWEYGTEEAFTLIPNHLATGILAILMGAATLVWSLGYLDRPKRATGLLVLGLLTFAVGGGIGMLVFLFAGWAVARRIGRPPRQTMRAPEQLRTAVTRARPILVGLGLVQYLLAIAIAITGYVPGMTDPDSILAVCWSLLAGSLVTFSTALVGTGIPDNDRPSARVYTSATASR